MNIHLCPISNTTTTEIATIGGLAVASPPMIERRIFYCVQRVPVVSAQGEPTRRTRLFLLPPSRLGPEVPAHPHSHKSDSSLASSTVLTSTAVGVVFPLARHQPAKPLLESLRAASSLDCTIPACLHRSLAYLLACMHASEAFSSAKGLLTSSAQASCSVLLLHLVYRTALRGES